MCFIIKILLKLMKDFEARVFFACRIFAATCRNFFDSRRLFRAKSRLLKLLAATFSKKCRNFWESLELMIPLLKKNNATECSDFRTINLILSKIMLKVLTKRIEAKVKNLLGRNQFGFRKGCGTRDAIGVVRTLCKISFEYENETYICFVDFEKAFDRVN